MFKVILTQNGTKTEVSDFQVARWDAKAAAKGQGKSVWVRNKAGVNTTDTLVRVADQAVLAVVSYEF